MASQLDHTIDKIFLVERLDLFKNILPIRLPERLSYKNSFLRSLPADKSPTVISQTNQWTLAGGAVSCALGYTTEFNDLDIFIEFDSAVYNYLLASKSWSPMVSNEYDDVNENIVIFNISPEIRNSAKRQFESTSSNLKIAFPQIILIRPTLITSTTTTCSSTHFAKIIDNFDIPICRNGIIVNGNDVTLYKSTDMTYHGNVKKERLEKYKRRIARNNQCLCCVHELINSLRL